MTIERIAFLGDSQSDQDEFWSYSTALLEPPVPVPPFYAQKFTNGEVHAQILPGLLGLEGGDATNYAVGSARALAPWTIEEVFLNSAGPGRPQLQPNADPDLLDDRIDLAAQTQRLLADAGDDPSTLAVVTWIGINDLNNWTPPDFRFWTWRDDLEDLIDDIADANLASVEAQLAAGLGEVWLATHPESSFYPAFDELPAILRPFSVGLIDRLNDRLADGIEALDDPRARILDLNALTDEIEADPANFRIDIDTPILLSTGSLVAPPLNPDLPAGFDFETDADEYGFIDLLHPSATTHGIIAAFAAEAIASNLITGSSLPDALLGTGGDDLVLASGGPDAVLLRSGDDVALCGTGPDVIWGQEGSDLISGGSGNDTLVGGAGQDLLTGGENDDLVFGSGGRDLIVDTAGSDTLLGGAGDDFFLWFEGDPADMDRIDGEGGADQLTLFLSTTASFDAAQAAFDPASASQSFAGLDVTGVESFAFVDLTVTPGPELPDLPEPLGQRAEEWDLWNFA